MDGFKSEYRRAADRLEPDGRLLESLKADMKKTAEVPPKPNFFVRYRWVFGSAAACLAVALAVGMFLTLGTRDMQGESSFVNEAATDGAAAAPDDLMENGQYGINNADGAEGAMPEPDGESGGAYPISTDEKSIEEAVTPKPGAAVEYEPWYDYAIPDIGTEQIEALKPLSYEELKALVMTDRGESNLIFSDFALYDYIERLDDDVYYLVLRYDRDGLTLPVVAAFWSESPWDTVMSEIVSLKICLKYDEADTYMDLRKISMEDLEYYFSPSEYVYDFGEEKVSFGEKDLDRLTPMTDEEFFELMNKVERGSLCLHDFAELERFGLGFSYYTRTLVCTYMYGGTGQGYALIAHFASGEEDAVPDYLILRRRDSLKEVDLLNDYDMLGRFLAG